MRTKKNERGFTLVEVLFSTAILGFVVLSSLKVLNEAHQMAQESRYRLVAANTARGVLETVKETPLALVPAINTANLVPPDLPSGVIQILTNPGNLNGVELATVTVRITWTNPKGLPGFLEVTTMRSAF